MARKSDTAGLRATIMSVAGPSTGEGSVSVSTRKIDNGYVTDISRTNAQGAYEHTETFHKQRPGVAIELNEGPEPTGNSMKRAVEALRR